ncbi:MAG TPA: alpha-2-macroglobulin family protein [Thermoanaerobaculia bacterium]|nr:alpha-2-macroglobulin family protein [Thermoanaerobaculia bacterium]
MYRVFAVVLLGLVLAFPGMASASSVEDISVPAAFAASWDEIEKLMSEGRLEEALPKVEKLLDEARAAGDEETWTRMLVRATLVRAELGKFEDAARFLKEQPRPSGAVHSAVLSLYEAETLMRYYRAYSREIDEREKVESEGEPPLEQQTQEQIAAATLAACRDAWSRRQELGDIPLSRLQLYLTPNNYPAAIRGTVRDALSYLYAELLGNRRLGSMESSNAIESLDLPSLIRGDTPSSSSSGQAVHPLRELAAVLADLETWHLAAGRREAALEARLTRLRGLRAAFTEDEDRKLIRRDLEEHLATLQDVPWWSMGMAILADLLKEEEEPGHLARARAAAVAGRDAWPGSPGGERCRSIAEEIEQPGFDLMAMESDGLGRRSLQVRHKNLTAVYFRAYPSELKLQLAGKARLSSDEVTALIRDGRPAAAWRSELPATPDFDRHTTWIVPPIDHPGAYIIVASSLEDFSSDQSNFAAVRIVLSDLVLVSRGVGSREAEVLALSGATGEPVSGAELRLYNPDGAFVGAEETGTDGTRRFPLKPDQSYRVLGDSPGGPARLDWVYANSPDRPDAASTLLYTDRAIYRPQQTIFWKVLAYKGSRKEGSFSILAGQTVTVTLHGADSQQVSSRTVTTNGFGTASGEFQIPAGLRLGSWTLRTSMASPSPGRETGSAYLKVEDYKRPTFEVVLDDPATPLRLGAPAKLTGRAVYYFGLPVTRGVVRWQIRRVPCLPSEIWVIRYSNRTVAIGTSAPGADGKFEIDFTPQPEARDREELTYEYYLSAEMTDDGGETHQAERPFRIGRATVEGRIASDRGFLLAGRPAFLTVTRRDLNGVPRPGAGSWSLYELRQPEQPLLPGDEPAPAAEDTGFRTPGDGLSPRWGQFPEPEYSLHGWPGRRRLAGGLLRHGTAGKAEIKLPPLRPGAYQLRWETLDDQGARAEEQKELIVAGARTSLALPAVLKVERATVRVGGTARLLVHSGFPGQAFYFEIWRGGERIERRTLRGGESPDVIEIPIGAADRGGLGFKLLMLRDHQLCDLTAAVQVPWGDRELRVGFATFRDHLRPGARETWKIRVRPPVGEAPEAAAAEVLATMTDRSLELFSHWEPPDPFSLYPDRTEPPPLISALRAETDVWSAGRQSPAVPELVGDKLLYGLNREWVRVGPLTEAGGVFAQTIIVNTHGPQLDQRWIFVGATIANQDFVRIPASRDPWEVLAKPAPSMLPRSNFAETAFWRPELLTGPDGTATIEFTVPDSVTEWNVFVQAVTRDLRAGTVRKQVRTARDLLVRPYLPRFLREGDQARLKVVVTNGGKAPMRGEVTMDITDPETGKSLLAEFGIAAGADRLPFTAAAGGGTNVTFPLVAPQRVGLVAFKITAVAGDESDGELRPLPLLPSRVHLAQSRFAALHDADRRELHFADLERNDDATRIEEQMVVTVDGQLFQGVLAALPYLVNYPYECTEQTLNRFVSTGMVTSLFDHYPAVARLAADLAKRETPLETWDATDPNRKLALEETPFLEGAQGGDGKDLVKVLDPRIARVQRDDSLAKLKRTQLASGAFPWWPGGPASPYLTVYVLEGLARAVEFGAEVPQDVVQKGWSYLAANYRETYGKNLGDGCCLDIPVLLNYTATAYPDPSWMGDALTESERRQILDTSFQHWTTLSPYLRSLLALTLQRMGRPADARLVFDSVLDRAKTTADEGIFWQPEARSWLWYNDTIESHAFALRALMELRPGDPRRHGLVQWLFLNKQLNHWKSTRATAEVLYAVVHYLQKEGTLGAKESATVRTAGQATTFTFEPDRYTGKANRVVIPGDKIDPAQSAVVVEKETPGFLFASATWHFSTEEPPAQGSGDLFHVSRRYFLRVQAGNEKVLKPLDRGAALQPGDEVEVQLTVSSRAPAEYVHLRDPRAAGLEPGAETSGWHWGQGLSWYQETRDSATNFFFEALPAGEYTLKYRLRANLAGEFRVGPATMQSMYAPEFVAYSGAGVVKVIPSAR